MAGSNLTLDNPGRNKLGTVALFAIQNGVATKINEVPGGEAAQTMVFTQIGKTVLVQFDVGTRARRLHDSRWQDGRHWHPDQAGGRPRVHSIHAAFSRPFGDTLAPDRK